MMSAGSLEAEPRGEQAPEVAALIDAQFPDLATQVARYPVRPGETPWTLAEARTQALLLLNDRERLLEELSDAEASLEDLLRDSGDGAGDDQADYGATALERDQELTLVNNLRDLVAQTDHTIDRLKAGTYATCEETGEAIGKARLQAFPRATLSVEAKARQERR